MIELTEDPIDCNRLLAQVSDPNCGGQVLFLGSTRRWTQLASGQGVETDFLYYEAYREMALTQMQDLAETAKRRWPIKHVAIVHRLGRVEPTESSVGVAVSSPHRSESFEAAKWLIDELKHEVPIWKQEHYVQNGAEWIHPTQGSCSCDHPGMEQTNAPRPNSASESDSASESNSASESLAVPEEMAGGESPRLGASQTAPVQSSTPSSDACQARGSSQAQTLRASQSRQAQQ